MPPTRSLTQGDEDVAERREFVHQMHGPGFGPQHFKKRGINVIKRDLQEVSSCSMEFGLEFGSL